MTPLNNSCHKHRRYPETLTQAFVRYLKGEGTLEQARQQWQAALTSNDRLHTTIQQAFPAATPR